MIMKNIHIIWIFKQRSSATVYYIVQMMICRNKILCTVFLQQNIITLNFSNNFIIWGLFWHFCKIFWIFEFTVKYFNFSSGKITFFFFMECLMYFWSFSNSIWKFIVVFSSYFRFKNLLKQNFMSLISYCY